MRGSTCGVIMPLHRMCLLMRHILWKCSISNRGGVLMRAVAINSAFLILAVILILGSFGFAASGPNARGNVLVDLDRGQAFPKNKQNEQAITRDPLTGALIVGANDELDEPLCRGTTVPLTSPCPFKKGV